MKSPLISVVIPIFSSGRILEQTIISVLEQTFQDFEIVLVDNNASPETRETALSFCTKYPERVFIVHESEQGVCSARNTGILKSRGTYIALLDDDDLMAPERLEKQLQAALDNPSASMITCGADYIEHSSGKIKLRNVQGAPHQWKPLEDYCRDLANRCSPQKSDGSFLLVNPCTMFFPKKKAIDAGLFDPRLNPNYGEDYLFCQQMYMNGNFVNLSEPLAIYRFQAPASLSTRRNPQKLRFLYIQGHKLFYVLWENFGKDRPENVAIFRKIATFHLRVAGRDFIRYEQGTGIGRALLFKAWKYSPMNWEILKDFIKSRFPNKLHPRLFWFESLSSDSIWMDKDKDFSGALFNIPPTWLT